MQMVAGGIKSSYLDVFKSDGTRPLTPGGTSIQDNPQGLNAGVTLVAGQTYYFPAPALKACTAASFHVAWDAAIVLTSVNLEQSDFPEGAVVTDFAATGSGWAGLGTAAGSAGLVIADATTGGTITNGVLAVAAGQTGDCVFTAVRNHAARTRVKVVVGATGGVLKVSAFGKAT